MKKPIYLFYLLLPCCLFAQTEKGATPLSPSHPLTLSPAVTRAVVVGISDYQDEQIPDLRFADKDAEASANFLRSPAGGSLDGDHLKLLTDSAATTAQFDAALGWLVDESKEGDQAIIYFSGHGDVETKTRSQQGFLLCWDSPPQAYVSGAYPIFFLKEIISTLSLENKAKVVVITDACRSGKLAGNSVGGSQLTSQNLSQQFANEIKILSCQPNEYSIEGEQWGGGRGAFSYYLVDGLYGMADGNADGSVNLMEIGRYLDDHVTTEVAPESQVPITVGNRTEKLAQVVPGLLALVKKNKAGELPTFSPTDSRGIEDDVLVMVDTTIRELYRLFKKSLKDKEFLEPDGACADAYYERLIAEPKMGRLHNSMRRNFAAALQDDAQQMMNTFLKTGLTKEVLSSARAGKIYKSFPENLSRAAELLGNEHYMYNTLMARKSYFEGRIGTTNNDRKKKYFQALAWQSDLPFAFVELIQTYGAEQADSAVFYGRKAMEVAPSWVIPYLRLASYYEHSHKQPEKAELLLEQAFILDSNAVIVWYEKARFYQRATKFEISEYWFKKVIGSSNEDICFPCAHNELGYTYFYTNRYEEAELQFKQAIALDSTVANIYNSLAAIYLQTNRYAEAEEPLTRAIRLDSTFSNAYSNLATVYSYAGRFEEAEHLSRKFIQLDSTKGEGYLLLAWVYFDTNRPSEAEFHGAKAIQLQPSNENYYSYSCLLARLNKLEAAFEALEQAINIGYDYTWMQQDSDLAPLREQKERWQALMKKYFPNQAKD
ncbi:MAG: tetratricopeptide repeat protein [Bacteroidales bacterium]|nr:tetratricopeptide repeat protein [Bacteroidales bacterium]